jgi:NADH dehydrogenase
VRHVVILGAGFAGLNLAKGLGGAPVRVTVVDRRNHHLFQPMLYQVATAALSPGDIASPIRGVLHRHRNIEVLLGDVAGVDVEQRLVRLDTGRTLAYDALAVGTGARHSYFGHPEWESLAPGLKSLEDAFEIRRRILLAFELAEQEHDAARRRALLNFVLVGAGPTGVELAGAIAEIKQYTLRRDFRNIDPQEARVILIEAGPRVLSTYPAELSAKAARQLARLGVEIHTDTMVTAVSDDSVVASGTRIDTRTVIWAAGNLASPLLHSLGAPVDRQGRVVVEPDCTIPGHPEVFVMGDAANYSHQTGAPLPGTCPVAIQMGKYVARVLRREASGAAGAAAPRAPFRYRDKGQLAVIGRGRGIADLGPAHFSGFPAWLLWIFVHIFFLIGFRNRVIVLIEWGISYFTFSRGARLITGEAPSPPP